MWCVCALDLGAELLDDFGVWLMFGVAYVSSGRRCPLQNVP